MLTDSIFQDLLLEFRCFPIPSYGTELRIIARCDEQQQRLVISLAITPHLQQVPTAVAEPKEFISGHG